MKRWLVLFSALPLLAFAAPQEKIITLGGDVTEIVYALGASSSLVARDSTSQWPQAANVLPDVGYLRQLNAEGILSMRPTLVLASAQAQPSLALKQVEQSHVRVIAVPAANDLSVIDEKVRIVAEATHREAEGEALRGKLRQALSTLPTSPLNKRVLFILNHGGMTAMAAGQQTGADAAIRAAGLQNAMQGFTRYQPLSQEGVIASRPDLVVISQDGINAWVAKRICGRCPGWRKPRQDVISRCWRLMIWRCWALACERRKPSGSCVQKRSNCPDGPASRPVIVDAGRAAGRHDADGQRYWRAAPAGQPALETAPTRPCVRSG